MRVIGNLFNWRQWLMLYCALSFTMLGVDAAMNHHRVLAVNILAYTPLIFAPLAVIYSAVGIFVESWRRNAWGLGTLALLVGGAGMLIHTYLNIAHRGDLSLWHTFFNAPRPVFAPAAFASTGLLLFLVAWGERRQHINTETTKESHVMKNYLPLILVVGALGVLLIVAGCRTQQRTTGAPPPPRAATPVTTTANPASTATNKITIGSDEASCPVLGTVMKKTDMISLQHKGNTYYMCCQDCVAKFKADPEKYIQNPAPPTHEMPHD